MKRLVVLAVVLGLVFGLTAGVGAQAVIRVGASPLPHAELLEFIKDDLAAQGIKLEIIEFTDYVQPNLALAEGELDANFFQHIPYMTQFCSDHGLDLVALTKVHIEPIGAYSQKLDDVSELPDGAIIAIPNDPTNCGRALALLEREGIIELVEGVGTKATILDIAANPKNVQIKELEAAQLPRVLPDVHLAIINTNYALEAGLVPMQDALFMEGKDSPYANVLTIRNGDQDREELQELAAVLNSEKVRNFLIEEYGGAVVPAF